ncbi:unnamed protein product [Prorocentrum cordatum]|uniref:Uncharacterized protein n=2 Tax=Prorocentrum cordatum TaxID=2364126 RepID=A0ABN9UUU6_9DINO|nr:unnamed protein product [Polarella glacialis]
MDKDAPSKARAPCSAAAVHGEVQSAVNGGALAHHGDGKGTTRPPPWRWVMLGILSADICVSYLPYYTFVPILPQARREYGVEEDDINVLCILYAISFVVCAFITGPVVGSLGCRWTFVFAMGFTAGGCALRCGPEFADQFFYSDFQLEQARADAGPASKARAFRWLLVGQAFCALGQPFLVNSCSHMGAEWFPPAERPAAAMISNLMNFIGSSMSFMLPSLVVDVHADAHSMSDQEVHRELSALLNVQFQLEGFAMAVSKPSSPQMTEDSQVAALLEQNNKLLQGVTKLLEEQNKLADLQNQSLAYIAEKAGCAEMRQCQASGEATDASRMLGMWCRGSSALYHKNIRGAALASALKNGSLEGIKYEGIFRGKDRRRSGLFCAIFFKTHIERSGETFNAFDDADKSVETLFKILPSFRAEFLDEAKTHDAMVGEKVQMMPKGPAADIVRRVLGEIPADLQALYEIMLPVNKQCKPILPSDSDEPDEDTRAFDAVASVPEAAKPYFEQFQANSIENYENERVLVTEGIVAWCRQIAEFAKKRHELDQHGYFIKRAKMDEDTKYQRKLEYEKNFFDIYVQKKFPSYYKIIEEYKEMCDEKKRKQELNTSEAQGAPARSSRMSQPSFIKQEVRAKLPQSAIAENPDKVEKPKNLKRENLKKEEKPLQDAKGSGSEKPLEDDKGQKRGRHLREISSSSDNEEKRAWQKAKRRKSAPQPEDEEPEGDEPEDEGPEDGDPESVHTPALHLLPERLQRMRALEGTFSEESLPFENAQDMFEGLRQELGLPRPPENTQQHLAENTQQHEAEVEHSGDELEAEAESPKFREFELPKEAGSETAEPDEEGSRPQELSPEESKRQEQLPEESSREPEVPDDEDSNRQELVPEEVKRQELLPEESKRLGEESEAYVVFSSPDTGATEPASDAEALAFASHGRKRSQWDLEGPAQAARESKPTVVKKPAQAVSRESKPTVSKKPSRAQIERKASTDKLDAVVQVETEVKMETTLKPESSWSETEIETHLDPAQEAELHASWRAERFNSGELTGPQGDEPHVMDTEGEYQFRVLEEQKAWRERIKNAKVLLICVWSDNPMHYTYLKVAEEEFQDVAIEHRDSLKVPSESAKARGLSSKLYVTLLLAGEARSAAVARL